MQSNEVRQKYLDFFQGKDHVIVPSSSIIPDNDPTTLFTGSGMQPMVPYLLGETHPKGSRIVDSQRCFRAEDIEEVGDNRHTTFFEMLGNWSFGDYFKEEQVPWVFEFLTQEIGIDPNKLYITVFDGEEEFNLDRDEETVALWKQLFSSVGTDAPVVHIGSVEDGHRNGMQGGRIFYYDSKKNWWSRSGTPKNMPAGEPGGATSEMFYDFGTPHKTSYGEHCHPNCDCGRFVEIGNSVFMTHKKESDGSFSLLPNKNIDFGGGFERIVAATRGDSDIFLIDIFAELIESLENLSGKRYYQNKKAFRIIADHIRGAMFMIADGVRPSNTEQGYFLRRLLRRMIVHADRLGLPEGAIIELPEKVSFHYKEAHPIVDLSLPDIKTIFREEEERFRVTLKKGLKEFEKIAVKNISGEDAFKLFSTYGFPLEVTEELAEEKGISVDRATFQEHMQKHQDQSRAGAEQKFKGGLADSSEKTTMLHTATHLMLASLRKHLGEHVHQAGSNITTERTRFDFTHPEKVQRDILDSVEAYVNDAISKKCDVIIEQIPKEEAQQQGVEGSFWERYPDVVNVYSVKCDDGTVYSQELCGGPHVKNTGDIVGTFKIKKEEASSAGVRRVKAVLE